MMCAEQGACRMDIERYVYHDVCAELGACTGMAIERCAYHVCRARGTGMDIERCVYHDVCAELGACTGMDIE